MKVEAQKKRILISQVLLTTCILLIKEKHTTNILGAIHTEQEPTKKLIQPEEIHIYTSLTYTI